MSKKVRFVFDVQETFSTTVEVDAASLDEAEAQIKGRIASVRTLDETLDGTKARVIDAPRHHATVRNVLKNLKEVA